VVKGSNIRVLLERRDQGERENDSSTGSHNAFRDSISSPVDRDTKGRVCREEDMGDRMEAGVTTHPTSMNMAVGPVRHVIGAQAGTMNDTQNSKR
jgi:hypothetical protein